MLATHYFIDMKYTLENKKNITQDHSYPSSRSQYRAFLHVQRKNADVQISKYKYLHLTSNFNPIPIDQSTLMVKGCIDMMFDMEDTFLSY